LCDDPTVRIVVGSETGGFGSFVGSDRVVRCVNVELAALLAGLDIDVVPVHTRPRHADVAAGPFAAAGPGLPGPVRDLADCDLLMLLGVDVTVDFAQIHRERRRRDLPVVAMVHDVLPIAHPEWFPPHGRTHYRAYLQQLVHVADAVVATTGAVRDDLLALGWRIRGDVHVVGLGTSYPQQPPTPAPPSPLGLLYVSTIAPYKGHLALLGAFDLLRAAGVKVELTIIGRNGWMSEEITDAIRHHPEYGRSLEWRQGATDDDVLDVARRCRVAVVPSLAEGFGLFLEEALSLGLAVVASDIAPFLERPYPNVTFSDPASPALAEAILRARDEPIVPLAIDQVRPLSAAGRDLLPIILSALGH
jgi:glycosyltransferase involved in cell wall biosynthesis